MFGKSLIPELSGFTRGAVFDQVVSSIVVEVEGGLVNRAAPSEKSYTMNGLYCALPSNKKYVDQILIAGNAGPIDSAFVWEKTVEAYYNNYFKPTLLNKGGLISEIMGFSLEYGRFLPISVAFGSVMWLPSLASSIEEWFKKVLNDFMSSFPSINQMSDVFRNDSVYGAFVEFIISGGAPVDLYYRVAAKAGGPAILGLNDPSKGVPWTLVRPYYLIASGITRDVIEHVKFSSVVKLLGDGAATYAALRPKRYKATKEAYFNVISSQMKYMTSKVLSSLLLPLPLGGESLQLKTVLSGHNVKVVDDGWAKYLASIKLTRANAVKEASSSSVLGQFVSRLRDVPSLVSSRSSASSFNPSGDVWARPYGGVTVTRAYINYFGV